MSSGSLTAPGATPELNKPGKSAATSPRKKSKLQERLGFGNIGAVYVLVAIIVIFSIMVPKTFPRMATVTQVLNASAITGLAALAIIIPLSAKVFDLSFAYTISLSGCVAAYLLTTGVPLPVAIVGAIVVALLIGVVNGVVVVVMRIDSFIGTLATGSLIQALITMFTDDNVVTGGQLAGSFAQIGQARIGGLTLPVFYTLLVAIAIWWLLTHTPTGRRIYATGFNADAAKLANIKVDKIRFLSLLTSSGIAGIAGVVLASTIGAGSPTTGVSYLLPAFAAVFLGATQFARGRFNAWGTLLAVILLSTGSTGLALAKAPTWSSAMFTGVVLIAALGFTGVQRRSVRAGRIRGLLARKSA